MSDILVRLCPFIYYLELGTLMIFFGTFWVRAVEDDARWFGLALVISGVMIDFLAWRYFIQLAFGGSHG